MRVSERRQILGAILLVIASTAVAVYLERAELWTHAEQSPLRKAGSSSTGPVTPGPAQRSGQPLAGSWGSALTPGATATMPDVAPALPAPGAPLQKSVADTLRFAAVGSSDEAGGLRVYPGRNRAAFAQLGLRPGDQLVAVNGAAAAGQSWEGLLASLSQGGGGFTITVERRGRLTQLEVPASGAVR